MDSENQIIKKIKIEFKGDLDSKEIKDFFDKLHSRVYGDLHITYTETIFNQIKHYDSKNENGVFFHRIYSLNGMINVNDLNVYSGEIKEGSYPFFENTNLSFRSFNSDDCEDGKVSGLVFIVDNISDDDTEDSSSELALISNITDFTKDYFQEQSL